MFNESFQNASNSFRTNGDRSYCAPLALALVTGSDPEETNNKLIAAGLRRHQRGMSTFNMIRYLDQENVLHEEVNRFAIRSMTMTTVGRRFPTGIFLVFVRGHVAALIDGEVQDWTAGRRHKVIRMERIGDTAPIAPPAPKVRRPSQGKQSKSQQMLVLLREQGDMHVDTMAVMLNTTANSVRCYVSYFRNGSRGHQQVSMRIIHGNIILFG